MTIKITIEKLKNIEYLEFSVPQPGAYLLTGSNGSGKTSLLTCLSRLRNSGAFQRGFRSSDHPSLDSYRGASVKYDINGDSVTYAYGEERWAPMPRRNSGLLATCGYPEVKYIAADGDRVEPKKEEFAPRSVRLTDQALRDALNEIFGTTRFDELCYIHLSRSGQSKAYLIRQTRANKQTLYFSERNFSLGELCVLKLLLSLSNIIDGSLVLIDELELAIHPRAQVKLFQHLTKLASKKNLTVIFSTHSVSLIKTVDRRKTIFLSKNNGVIRCISGCYPTYSLGQISSGEEVAPDCVIYVEDDSAKKCVESMVARYHQKIQGKTSLPTVVTVPLGGFKQILEFLDKAPHLLPKATRIHALLDQDVQTESLAEYQEKQDHYMLSLFQRLSGSVKFLPWTPEVGFINLVRLEKTQHENGLKAYFGDQRLAFPNGWPSSIQGLTPKQVRDTAKKDVHLLSVEVTQLTGKSTDKVREGLFDYLVQSTLDSQSHDLVGLIGSVIHS